MCCHQHLQNKVSYICKEIIIYFNLEIQQLLLKRITKLQRSGKLSETEAKDLKRIAIQQDHSKHDSLSIIYKAFESVEEDTDFVEQTKDLLNNN